MFSAPHCKRLRSGDIDDVVTLSSWVHHVSHASHPSQRLTAIRNAGVPKPHRLEVRKRGPFVAAAVDHSQLAVFVQTLEPSHRRMKAKMIVDLTYFCRRDADGRSVA